MNYYSSTFVLKNKTIILWGFGSFYYIKYYNDVRFLRRKLFSIYIHGL